jgi:hypothetical protein
MAKNRTTQEIRVAGRRIIAESDRAKALIKLANNCEIGEHRRLQAGPAKVPQPAGALALHLTFWWQWVAESLTGLAVDPATRDWLAQSLLPTVHWHQRSQRTENKRQREACRQAWQRAVHALQTNEFAQHLPESELQRWVEWAEWMAGKFHRSSSAVEGRNGRLSHCATMAAA